MHDIKSETKNKPILIVPAAGKSSRYPNMRPKWMLTHPSGKLMIEKVIDGLDLKQYKKAYFVILKEHCEKYEADFILKQAFPDNFFEVVILDKPTESSPETVYCCIKQKNIDDNIVVKDCDCLVSYEHKNHDNFVVSLNLNDNNKIYNIQKKSFIIKTQDNIIQEIIEKKISSDTVCLGVYGMNTNSLIYSYEKLSKVMKHELYFSHIVSDLIDAKNEQFICLTASEYIDWGTREEWFSSGNRKKTYIFDIDGILIKNIGKYGRKNWYNTIEPIQENIEVLKKLSKDENEIIFITSRPENALDLFKNLMQENEIKYKTIIHSSLHSRRIIINDFSNTNPFPSCLAINIERNSHIEPYLN